MNNKPLYTCELPVVGWLGWLCMERLNVDDLLLRVKEENVSLRTLMKLNMEGLPCHCCEIVTAAWIIIVLLVHLFFFQFYASIFKCVLKFTPFPPLCSFSLSWYIYFLKKIFTKEEETTSWRNESINLWLYTSDNIRIRLWYSDVF